MTDRFNDDRGAATVFACFVMLALIVVTVLIVQVGSLVAVRHRAQSAADLAALAVAGSIEKGADAACAAAEPIASRMSAAVRECRVDGWDAVVTVTADVALPRFGAKEVQAIARAGPVDEE
ncbi:Rv3654c family TadE-like protein [Antrihabitans sp. NCIMB 15449]|uniref:Rv3654c family TadE-like protein n=1 Tax=Antrihabitans spumae TaxID=3373370 RepID=A0ABW7JNW9_9NOCA